MPPPADLHAFWRASQVADLRHGRYLRGRARLDGPGTRGRDRAGAAKGPTDCHTAIQRTGASPGGCRLDGPHARMAQDGGQTQCNASLRHHARQHARRDLPQAAVERQRAAGSVWDRHPESRALRAGDFFRAGGLRAGCFPGEWAVSHRSPNSIPQDGRTGGVAAAAVIIITFALGRAVCAQQDDKAPEFGSVAGHVVDRQGKPMEGVQVSALPLEQINLTGKAIFATTGSDGGFLLHQVHTGWNMVCVAKEADLYPDTRFTVSTDDITLNAIVRVRPGEAAAGVFVMLGRKGVKLVGSIVDNPTGLMVQDTALLLHWADDPSKSIEATADLEGQFEFVVAPRPLRLEVSAAGYRRWISPVIQTEPGEKKSLTVRLQPDR